MSGLSGIGTPLRGSGKNQSVWKLEWTYGASNAVTFDSAQSDEHIDIATPITDSGAGEVAVVFPKCSRAWVMHSSVEPATPGTGANHRLASVHTLSATGGTCNVVLTDFDTAAATDPESGSRARLTLILEFA